MRLCDWGRAAGCLFVAAAYFATSGCGQKEEIPELVSVTGKVTFQGQPLANASISFVPADEDKESTLVVRPHGQTDEQGQYELSWHGDHDGAPPGKYQVMVMAFKPNDNDDEEIQPESLIPKKYNSPKTSGLNADVSEDGENVFNFDL